MVELIFDKVNSVNIGRTAGDCVTITNVLAFAERIVSVEDAMVRSYAVINDFNPSGVHHSHKYRELLLVLDTDWLTDTADHSTRWAYTQKVNAANTKPAIDEDGDNTAIEYFVVTIRGHDGAPTTRTYASVTTKTVWCVGETSEFSNEEATPHQTVTFRFICLGDLL